MNNITLEFYLPTKVFFGFNVVEKVGEEVQKSLGKKVLVVTGKASTRKYGLLDKITKKLAMAGVEFAIYDKVEPNPTTETVEEGAKMAQEAGCDMVLGVGGGSSIDAAKVVATLATNGGQCIDFKGEEKIKSPPLPIIAIPTTSGSGSEVTRYAVITQRKKLDKFEIVSHFICPKVALVDPKCTLTMSKELTASTGMDALTHAIEGYVSRKAQPLTDILALHAMQTVAQNLEVAVKRRDNLTARENMSLAALYGGIIINNVRTGLAHALARPLGGYFGIPHGIANAVVLPQVMRFNLSRNLKRFRDISEAFGENIEGLPMKKAAQKSVEAVTKLSRIIGIPNSLKELGVPYEAIPKLANEAFKVERLRLVNPRSFTLTDVVAVCRRCWKGDLIHES